MSSQLCVFTTGSHTELFEASCARVMITPAIYLAKWSGYVTVKLREGIKFLSTRTEPYAMWCDGNDSLIIRPEDHILARLHALGDPVLISAEANCWPDDFKAAEYARKNKYPHLGDLPQYINAGGFIGPIGDVLTAMNTALSCANGGEDDQRAWTDAYLSGLIPGVQIDHARYVFSCVADGADALKADCCAIHWNGRMAGREEYWSKLCAV